MSESRQALSGAVPPGWEQGRKCRPAAGRGCPCLLQPGRARICAVHTLASAAWTPEGCRSLGVTGVWVTRSLNGWVARDFRAHPAPTVPRADSKLVQLRQRIGHMWLRCYQKASPIGIVSAGRVMAPVLMSLQTLSHSHCVNVLHQG